MTSIQTARASAARTAGLVACQRQVEEQMGQLKRAAGLLGAASVPGRGNMALTGAMDLLKATNERLGEVYAEVEQLLKEET